MSTMSVKLRQAMMLALGETWDSEFETILDAATAQTVSAGLEAKIRNWLADDTLATELVAALESSRVDVSQPLRDRIKLALADEECGTDLVTLIDAIAGSSHTPSSTRSATPSMTVSMTPSSTPSATGV
jgi:hypothetical protein